MEHGVLVIGRDADEPRLQALARDGGIYIYVSGQGRGDPGRGSDETRMTVTASADGTVSA